MKKLALASFAFVLFGAGQVPALADTVWFKTYDVNHDGSWSYPEYVQAETHYYTTHPKVVRVTTEEMRRNFDTLDTGHTGTVKIEQVRTIHDWD